MEEITLEKLPLLRQTLRLVGEQGRGSCFHRAAALLLDLPWGNLCVGTLRGATEEEIKRDKRSSPVPFIHAWVEQKDKVLAPTTLENTGMVLRPFLKEDYYDINSVRNVHKMNRAKVLKLAKKHGWMKVVPFGDGNQLKEPLGAVILREMGVSHRINDRGGIVPE